MLAYGRDMALDDEENLHEKWNASGRPHLGKLRFHHPNPAALSQPVRPPMLGSQRP
jgi:hypothetical protein